MKGKNKSLTSWSTVSSHLLNVLARAFMVPRFYWLTSSLVIIGIAVTFVNWHEWKDYLCHLAHLMGGFSATFCPGMRRPETATKLPPSSSVMGNYSSAAVSVDADACSQVGM